MLASILQRLAASVVLLFLVLTVTFLLVRVAPGSPLNLYEDPRIPRAQIEELRRAYGLDLPLHEQYWRWLRAVVVDGDWGVSFVHQRPATEVIAQALPNTLLLGLAALLLQYGGGVVLGVFAARRAGSFYDSTLRFVSLLLYSVPTFWLGLMAILIFHLHWRLLPAGGLTSPGGIEGSLAERALDVLRHLVLPASVLGLTSAARIARFVRNSLLDTLSQDHVRTARAKGLSEARVLWRHGMRNSLVPVIQLLGLSLPALFNGALIIEVVFAWPGLGRLLYQASATRDYPVLLAGTALGAVLVIVGSLVADLLHRAADPRVRHA